jgi:hypothetical protein
MSSRPSKQRGEGRDRLELEGDVLAFGKCSRLQTGEQTLVVMSHLS